MGLSSVSFIFLFAWNDHIIFGCQGQPTRFPKQKCLVNRFAETSQKVIPPSTPQRVPYGSDDLPEVGKTKFRGRLGEIWGNLPPLKWRDEADDTKTATLTGTSIFLKHIFSSVFFHVVSSLLVLVAFLISLLCLFGENMGTHLFFGGGQSYGLDICHGCHWFSSWILLRCQTFHFHLRLWDRLPPRFPLQSPWVGETLGNWKGWNHQNPVVVCCDVSTLWIFTWQERLMGFF